MDKRNSLGGIGSPNTIQEEVANDLRHNRAADAMNSQQNINSGQQLTIKEGSYQQSGAYINDQTINQFLTNKSIEDMDKIQTIF